MAYVEDPLKFIVYAPPGQGKTVLLSSCSEDERTWPCVFADFEAGLKSVRSKVRRLVLPGKRSNPKGYPVLGTVKPVPGKMDVVQIKEWEDFEVLAEYIGNVEAHPYKAILFDSLSEMNYLNMNQVLEGATKVDLKHDIDILEQRDYLRSSNQMRKMIRFFRDLDMHIIFSAAAQQMDNPQTKLKMWFPKLTGGLALEVPGLIDVMGYLGVLDDGSRFLQVQPTTKFIAKDRTEGGLLSPGIMNPTITSILDLAEGLATMDEDGNVLYEEEEIPVPEPVKPNKSKKEK